MKHLNEPPLDGEEIEDAVLPALPPHAADQYRRLGTADASLRKSGQGRFRVNLHRERGRAAASIRALPLHPPQLAELGLPQGIEALTRLTHGLVLVGGPTGSGKTTVEIGIDAPDLPTALRSAVRQSPDVIVVGEMRDPETMRIGLAAGETGHLVFSTVHTTDVTSTISRVADAFPSERQPTIRQELSMALAAAPKPAFQSGMMRSMPGRRSKPASKLAIRWTSWLSMTAA